MLGKHHTNTTNTNNTNYPNNPNNLNNTNNTFSSGASTQQDPNWNSSNTSNLGSSNVGSSNLGSSNISHTFDADKDKLRNQTSNYGTTGTTNTGTYGSNNLSTGLGSQQPFASSNTGIGATGSGNQQYSERDILSQNQPHSGHHSRMGTQYAEPQYSGTSGSTYTGTQQPYSGTGTQSYTGTQQPYSGTTSETTAPGGIKTMHTVESVTRDAQAQIDAQVEEALRKSRELNAQDHARLQSSIREATASLEEQARVLKAQIDQEKIAAEQSIKQTQSQKLQATAQQQQLEERKILEAAAKRKLELETKAMRLQQEIDEIVRQKTAQMMQEKPGNLCFTHQHQDTTVGAQLAGDIGHVLDLKNSGRVTETTMQGDVQYQPVQVQQQPVQMNQSNITPVQAQEHTVQGPETHEKKGGFFHALKTAFTGHHEHGTQHANKHGQQVNNPNYDQQSTWASDADKHSGQYTTQPTQ